MSPAPPSNEDLARMRAELLGVGTEADVDLKLNDPGLVRLLTLWRDKAAGREMPAREDFEPPEFGSMLSAVALVDVTHEPLRFRWRLIGTDMTTVLGRDNTGKWFDDIYDDTTLTGFSAGMEFPVRLRRPVRLTGAASATGRSQLGFEALTLPLSADGVVVNMVLLSARYLANAG